MTNLMKVLSLCLVLTLGACSSSKKSGGSNDGSGADIDNQGLDNKVGSLNVGGSSDYGTAGALSTIYFDFNSAAITSSSKETLTANAQYLKSNPEVSIQVEGHCDERGGIQYNLALSEKRAKSVRDFLVALGVKSNKVTTIGYGKEKPVEVGHDEMAWSKNRRANFTVTKK